MLALQSRLVPFCCSVKLIEHLVTVVIAVSYNPSLGPLPRINISLFLLSGFTEELLGTPNITTF